jgi:lysozyme
MDLVPLVKHFEGLHRVVRRTPAVSVAPYLCPANYWTIGYGHLCRQDHPEIGEPEAEAFLERDLAVSRAQMLSLTRPRLAQHQEDALTSFVFNLGVGRYRGSTMRALVNRGEFDAVPEQLQRWVFAGGRKLPGLVLRREAEARLWSGIT